MPKAAPSRTVRDDNPHVLKRHQACHQCRKRKMKCDAKRPCSSCVRSHAYAILHAGEGTVLPAKPECTYDEVAEILHQEDAVSDEDRYTALETRIFELEAKLRANKRSTPKSVLPSDDNIRGVESFRLPSFPVFPTPVVSDESAPYDSFASIEPVDQADPFTGAFQSSALSTVVAHLHSTPAEPGLGQVVLPNSWPPELPSPSILRHLVEAFFTYHLHAHHLLHAQRFLESLSFLPSDPRFPSAALLHILCAIGCRYTATTLLLPHASALSSLPGSLHLSPEVHRTQFAVGQATLAKRVAEKEHSDASKLVQHLQTNILLTWFYWWQAKWIEAYTQAALTLRIAVSMGLNKSPPFQSISEGIRPLSMIPPASDLFEAELRRNAFWLAYAMERHYGCGNGWALSLDDQDVSELLPAPADHFTSGKPLSLDDRQWTLCRDLFEEHPSDHTDSFILYIKSTIFLSRVKNFNLRYRAKFYTMSPDDAVIAGFTGVTSDPRQAPEFRELERISSTFRDTFPTHLKHPIVDGAVDPYIFSAILAPHIGKIALHEPYAMVGKASCVSAASILRASRSILDLIHVLTSSSYDMTRIGLFPIFAWFTSGRVLTRFLKGAQREESNEQICLLETEISFVWATLSKLGERVPLSLRYARMLHDHIANTCDDATAQKVGVLAENAKPPRRGPNLANAPELQESNLAEANLIIRMTGSPDQSTPLSPNGAGSWYERIDHPLF